MGDIVAWLRRMGDYCRVTTTNDYRYDEAADEIELLRAALKPFAEIALLQDDDHRAGLPDMIDMPDFAITPADVRRARDALRQSGNKE